MLFSFRMLTLSIFLLGTIVSAASFIEKGATFDYIIVGGGVSGLVVAHRLSENPGVSILLIEYGDIDRSNITQVPHYVTLPNTAHMFQINSAPEPFIGNASFSVQAGAVLGGGSIVNGMALGRASSADYDSWEQLGNPGWGWDGLLPYFKKATTFMPPTSEQVERYGYTWNNEVYGHGPLKAGFPDWQYPDEFTFFKGFAELGVPFQTEHANGNATMLVWEPAALDTTTMTRSSALTAYYDTASNRTNLSLLTEHQVTEIIFSSDLTAKGVQVLDRRSRSTFSMFARKEVILAPGAVHTPQLLQLSGIGPKSVLEAAGIEVKKDLPAVGSNFQDHPVAYFNFALNNTFPDSSALESNETFNQESLQQYLANRTGPYTQAQSNSIAFLPLITVTDKASTLASALSQQYAQSYLPSIYTSEPALLRGYKAQRTILATQIAEGRVASLEYPFVGGGFGIKALQKPLSRGTIQLNTTDPHAEPIVVHNAFQNPFDKHQLYAGIQFIRRLFNTSALSTLNPVELLPGAEVQTEEEVFDALEKGGLLNPTFAHPSGTCSMMPKDKGGCVGADLLVYGTKRLSVIDASIIPIIPANHLQATVYAVAEKAADIIKSRS